jgi:basic membrane protein A
MMRISTKLTGLGATALVAVGLSTAAQAQLKVGFIYVGPIGDHGWSYEHNQGRLAIEKAFGDKVKTTYVEKVPEGADAQRVITKLATTGHNLIFTTSFGYMNPTLRVAKRFPNVKFEHATGFKRDKNVSTYSARFYEGRYVVGKIVGKMTKTNVLGYVASFPIPEVIRGINATILAARSVNPAIKIKVVWVSTWFDPGKEADAAKTLIDQGADVIMQHTDSPAPVQVAEQRGIWAVGQASDMTNFGPKAHLTAIMDNWGPYYIARAKAVMDGTWESKDTWDGIKPGMVTFAPFNKAIPADVVKLAEETRDGIAAGKIHPFAGEIKDQQGNVLVKAGENASDKFLAGMNVYVEGVDGSIPK